MNAKNARVGGAQKVQRQVDAQTDEWLNKSARNPATVTARQRYEQQRVRANMDVAPDVKAALEKLAAAENTSLAQLSGFLLAWALREYAGGQHETLKTLLYDAHIYSPSPRCAYKLEIPPAWADTLKPSFEG
jgi:hypothetical protein